MLRPEGCFLHGLLKHRISICYDWQRFWSLNGWLNKHLPDLSQLKYCELVPCHLKRVIFVCVCVSLRLVRLVVQPVFSAPIFLDPCGTPPWWSSYKETRTSKTYLPRYLTKEWNFRKEIPFGNLVVLPRWLYGSVVLAQGETCWIQP